MIFALVDYWKYRNQRGKYSDASLESKGWLRATKENIQRLMADDSSRGQIFFTHPRRSLVSWAIMYAQGPGTLASHVGIVVNDGNICEALVSQGTVKRSLSVYADGFSYFMVSKLEIPPETQDGLVATAEEFLGVPYNLVGIARQAWLILSGWDKDHNGNYPVYADVLSVLSFLALPCSRWSRFARRLIPLYLLVVALGRILRRRRQHERLPRPHDWVSEVEAGWTWYPQGEA